MKERLTPARTRPSHKLGCLRVPQEQLEPFPFAEFWWRRVKLVSFLLGHFCSYSGAKLLLPSAVASERASRACAPHCTMRQQPGNQCAQLTPHQWPPTLATFDLSAATQSETRRTRRRHLSRNLYALASLNSFQLLPFARFLIRDIFSYRLMTTTVLFLKLCNVDNTVDIGWIFVRTNVPRWH